MRTGDHGHDFAVLLRSRQQLLVPDGRLATGNSHVRQ
jgi:hypothetical protein